MVTETKIPREKTIPNSEKNGEYGFYIACDDRSILNCVNAMLLSSGVVGLSDTEGRMHYLIDGRRGRNYAVQKVNENVLLLKERFREEDKMEDILISSAIDRVLSRNGFRSNLIGTQLIHFCLMCLYRDPELIKSVSKKLYPMIETPYKMSSQQIERNIRYSITKSDFHLGGILVMLRVMRDAVVDEVMRSYGRGESSADYR